MYQTGPHIGERGEGEGTMRREGRGEKAELKLKKVWGGGQLTAHASCNQWIMTQLKRVVKAPKCSTV
jgi:hypothetical protein